MARRLLFRFALLPYVALSQTKPIHLTATFRPAPEAPAELSAVFPPTGSFEGFQFAQVPEGIWIAGGPPVALALPASQLAPLPRPGRYTRYGRAAPTGGQTAAEFCQGTAQSADCEGWLHRSERRRTLLRQLVSRRFELRGKQYVETRSAPAAKALGSGDDAALVPRGVPELRQFEQGSGVLIPWDALPPRSELTLESIPIQIAIEASKVVPVVVHLRRPRQFRFSPCHLPLTAVIERLNQPQAEPQPGFFLPQQSDLLDTIHGWKDPHDYSWEIPGLILHTQTARFTQLGEDEWLCGPLMKHRNGAAETALGEATDLAGFDVVRLPEEGGFFAVSRPRKHPYGGNGAGGPCAGDWAVSWAVYYFKPLPLRPGTYYDHFHPVLRRSHLRLNCTSNEPIDYEVELSADLQTIAEFEAYGEFPGGKSDWRSRTFTWKDGKYTESAWKPSLPPASSLIRRKQARW